jgi:hypothetical protein
VTAASFNIAMSSNGVPGITTAMPGSLIVIVLREDGRSSHRSPLTDTEASINQPFWRTQIESHTTAPEGLPC